jgi:viroplasmin and RNaseH domain-containing protein
VNGFPGNRYKGYMSRAAAEENWRKHLRQQNRTSNFIVTTTTFLFVVACVLYYFFT